MKHSNFSLMDKTAVDIVFIFLLVTYPLLSLDRIGLELQYPFDIESLSHLPLTSICNTILANGLSLLEEKDAEKDILANKICKDLGVKPVN